MVLPPMSRSCCGLTGSVCLVAAILFAPAAYAAAAGASPVPYVGTPLYLSVVLNNTQTGLIAAFVERDGSRLASTPQELHEIGIVVTPGEVRADGYTDLDGLTGISYRYDAVAQVVAIDASMKRLAVRRIDGSRVDGDAEAATAVGVGAVGGYTLYGSIADDEVVGSAALSGRIFSPTGVFNQSGILGYDGNDKFRAIRLDSTWTHSTSSSLRTYRVGDFISGGLPWTRPVRLGGIQISRNFGLRPGLVTAPIPAFSGTAAVPSTVDIYANGSRVYSGDVPAGPFSVGNLPIVSGAGTANIVITDALGRTTQSAQPYFTSQSLLARGLLDYSFEAGFPRRSYGVDSFDYASTPAASGTMRYGISDSLTVEGHVEGSARVLNAGVGVLTPVLRRGLLSIATTASLAERTGVQVSADLLMQFGSVTAEAASLRTFGDYADVASTSAAASGLISAGALSAVDRFSVTLPVGAARSPLTASYTHIVDGDDEERSLLGLSYSTHLNSADLYLTGYQSFDGSGDAGVVVGLTRRFGDISASAGASVDRSGRIGTLDVSKAASLEPGSFGWRLHGGISGHNTDWLAGGAYRSRVARFAGQVHGTSDSVAASGEISGSVVAMRGGMFFANRIDDSFAVVDAGVPDVMVYSQNRPVGKTDSRGMLLVPGLHSWQDNTLAIDPDDLPIDAEPGSTKLIVRPPDRSGVYADFGVARNTSSATVVLHDRSGSFLPPGAAGEVVDGDPFVVGYDGEVYIRHLGSTNRIVVTLGPGRTCSAAFPFAGGASAVIDNVVCQ
jgi:outer membrane usher protein